MAFKSAKLKKSEQNQNWDFHRHVFNAIFFFTQILPFSKSYPELESTWPTAKCRGRNSFDTWYYIVTCATLCVNFSSKLKTINIFPKHILKSKAKKLTCHVIPKNYLSNVSWKFLIKIESTWKETPNERTGSPAGFTVSWQDYQKQPPEMLYKKTNLKNFAISIENTCVGVYF